MILDHPQGLRARRNDVVGVDNAKPPSTGQIHQVPRTDNPDKLIKFPASDHKVDGSVEEHVLNESPEVYSATVGRVPIDDQQPFERHLQSPDRR